MEEMKQSLSALITAAYAPRPRPVEQVGSAMRKTNIIFVTSGAHDWLRPDVGARRFFVVDQSGRTALGRVAATPHPHPPVGTPGREGHAGNSTPAAALVAGVRKSERVGERGSAK